MPQTILWRSCTNFIVTRSSELKRVSTDQPVALYRPGPEPPYGPRYIIQAVLVSDPAQTTIHKRISGLVSAGADQVVLNLITRDRSVPYLPELRILASLNSAVA